MNNQRPAARLSLWQQITFSIPSFSMNVSGMLFASWLTYFYLPPEDETGVGKIALVAASAFAVAQFAGRIIDAIADPLVGYWSDRCRSRLGRRMPFLLFGAPLLAVAFGSMWFPPFEAGSFLNSAYLVFTMCLYWFAFTVVVAPYFALIPEIATSDKQRVSLSSFMAIFTILGGVAAVAIGPVQEAYPNGMDMLGLHIPSGLQFMALVSSLMLMICFWIPFANIRETPWAPHKEVPKGLFAGIKVAFKNPAFRTYLTMGALVQMGLNIVVVSIPYLATQVLETESGNGLIAKGSGESWTSYLTGGVFVLAAVQVPLVNFLVPRLGKKKLFLLTGAIMAALLLLAPTLTMFPDPAIPAIVLFALLSFPVANSLVLPNAIYADVVDYDAERSGVRREGTYTGAQALVTKAAIGLAIACAVGLLTLGKTRENPLGILLCLPLGAIFVAVGTLVFTRHPIDK